MKKTILITSGILLLLIISGIWVYLLLSGTQQNTNNNNTDFPIGGTVRTNSDDIFLDENADAEVDSSIHAGGILRQLTTRPVAGAVFITNAVRFAERGTGHIYDITLDTNTETQQTVTTKPRVTNAIFSPSGTSVALISENGFQKETFVGVITKDDSGTGIIEGFTTDPFIYEIGFGTRDDEAFFLQSTTEGSLGFRYNIQDNTTTQLFSAPISDVYMIWKYGIYVVTKASARTIGNIYQVIDGALVSIRKGGNALMAFTYPGGIVTTELKDGKLASKAFENKTEYILPLTLFPEKCTAIPGSDSRLVCAAPVEIPDIELPDSWYKGVTTLNDMLWSIDIKNEEATLLSILENDAREIIDVSTIVSNVDGTKFLLVNKLDGSLWLYDTFEEFPTE